MTDHAWKVTVFWLCAGALGGCPSGTSVSTAEPVRVAAASDMRPLLEALVPEFERTSGQRVAVSFGSTGMLATQLSQGAPVDLFAAAQKRYTAGLVAAGVCDGSTETVYARGRLVLWTGDTESPPQLAALREPKYAHIALAQPEHAPYGRAAQEALQHEGLWDLLQSRFVYGENVAQAWQFAQSGNADVALVARSLVVHDREHGWVAIPARLHTPLEQTLVRCLRGHNPEGAQRLLAFLTAPRQRARLEAFGFDAPEN